jgi:hypothetical protein
MGRAGATDPLRIARRRPHAGHLLDTRCRAVPRQLKSSALSSAKLLLNSMRCQILEPKQGAHRNLVTIDYSRLLANSMTRGSSCWFHRLTCKAGLIGLPSARGPVRLEGVEFALGPGVKLPGRVARGTRGWIVWDPL